MSLMSATFEGQYAKKRKNRVVNKTNSWALRVLMSGPEILQRGYSVR